MAQSQEAQEWEEQGLAMMPIFDLNHQRSTGLWLPIPSPGWYHDNYYQPGCPLILPSLDYFVDPVNRPFALPQPLGELTANNFVYLGVRFHDFGYVNNNPDKLFTKVLLWYIEINDHLFRKICPSDLNGMPCEWDELQGGCPLLRLCEMKHKYEHPHLGQIPACEPDLLHLCRYIHNVEPSCRSIARNLRKLKEEEPQLCETVARAEMCQFGHDFESARVEAVYRYWEHKNEARLQGSIGYVSRDVFGRKLLRMAVPLEVAGP